MRLFSFLMLLLLVQHMYIIFLGYIYIVSCRTHVTFLNIIITFDFFPSHLRLKMMENIVYALSLCRPENSTI